jgi:hypothetical protein
LCVTESFISSCGRHKILSGVLLNILSIFLAGCRISGSSPSVSSPPVSSPPGFTPLFSSSLLFGKTEVEGLNWINVQTTTITIAVAAIMF